jgi:2-polyprenyl-6-methoxyphenol hydroxylase-like FAD-dependent oxidoreductase
MTGNVDHAVILGSGIGGLSAAAVLAPRFRHVTVLERDTPPSQAQVRRGVPQAAHFHGLVSHGCDLLDEILPSFGAQLIAKGATPAELLSQVHLEYFGSVLKQVPIGLDVILASRPFLEAHLRQRVKDLPNVTVTEGAEAVGLLASHRHNRITGVQVSGLREAGQQSLDCDLVVDATGRAGRGATWLAAQGWHGPAEKKTRIDIAYTSCHYRLPPDASGAGKVFLSATRPDRPRGMIFVAQENNQWVLSLYGHGKGHRPPSEPRAFDAYARELLPPEGRDVLDRCERVGDISTYRVPSTISRDYSSLRNLPHGLVAVGEAVSSINPLYGTGMTAAVAEALVLAECVDRGTTDLPRQYYCAIARTMRMTWLFAALADRTLPEVPGTMPAVRKILSHAFARFARAGSKDAYVATALVKILDMTMQPTGLLHPRLLVPVLRGGADVRGRRRAGPVLRGPGHDQITKLFRSYGLVGYLVWACRRGRSPAGWYRWVVAVKCRQSAKCAIDPL